jgi:hypothetical protein
MNSAAYNEARRLKYHEDKAKNAEENREKEAALAAVLRKRPAAAPLH